MTKNVCNYLYNELFYLIDKNEYYPHVNNNGLVTIIKNYDKNDFWKISDDVEDYIFLVELMK